MNDKYKILVSKKILLLLASLVWAIAGFNILKIALEEFKTIESLQLIGILGGFIGFALFFNFVFFKMYKKHTKRIVNIEEEKASIFNFFDKKGYIIMAFMITIGISLRAFNIISGLPLVIIYLSIGLSLSSASIAFLLAFIRFEKIVDKYRF